MDKKYQVFVSSTYEDLKAERLEVIQALLELNCIPSGMELFPAANEDQWKLITEVIDECDYYILILGGRYGSVGEDGIGYTEKEYKYALENKKPIIAFLHHDPGLIPADKTEKIEDGIQKLKDFRSLVQKKVCKFWENPSDLGGKVSRGVSLLQKRHPGIGWVRADQVPDKEASQEILDLKRQLESMAKTLEEARTEVPAGTDKFAQGGSILDIEFTCKGGTGPTYMHKKLKMEVGATWDTIIYCVAPSMIHEANDGQFKSTLDEMVESLAQQVLADRTEYDGFSFSSFEISNEDFQTIKVQLLALGLIRKNDKNRSVKDTMAYWTLTPYGETVMNKLRAITVA